MDGLALACRNGQRLLALDRANEIRSYRKQLKRDLKVGRRQVWDLLLSGDDRLRTMQVRKLLLAVPKVGPSKLDRAFRAAALPPGLTAGRLTEQQLRRLAVYLPHVRPMVAVE